VEWLGDPPGVNCQAMCEAKSGGKWSVAELAKCVADCQGAKPEFTACELECAVKHPSDPAALAACRVACALSSQNIRTTVAKPPPPKSDFPWGPALIGGALVVGLGVLVVRGGL
jgi:hypothetical protein